MSIQIINRLLFALKMYIFPSFTNKKKQFYSNTFLFLLLSVIMFIYGPLEKWFNSLDSHSSIHGFEPRTDYHSIFKVDSFQPFYFL